MSSGIAKKAALFQDEVSLCVAASGLDAERAGQLVTFAREHDQSLIEVLIDRAGVEEFEFLRRLADLLEVPYLGEPPDSIGEQALAAISPSLAMSHKVVPIAQVDGMLQVACSDPFEWRRWDELGQILDRPLQKVLSPRPVIERMLTANYGLGADTVERLLAGRGQEEQQLVTAERTDLSEEAAANEPTVVNLVNRILTEAIRLGATDIHFEPYESKYRIRYRIDGMLEDVSIPISVKLLKLALVSRIKIMASLDITEKRLPQDGRAQVSLAGQQYDLRVSILPGVHGEAVDIRLQSRHMIRLDLEALGFEQEEGRKIEYLSTRPHGLMLVTGPTGSGKTTTLYSCLKKITQPQTKIITVEDPVEYWMEDILQMQVHDEIGFTFARALRSMLRHDPDVMLVGEIRDRETADIAIRASLTGHLVFATLHTNDAASAVTRLLDIGIEPFLAASSLSGIVAQRLVRRICTDCKHEIRTEALVDMDLSWGGNGCQTCRFTGFRGRSAIGEVLMVSTEIREMIQGRETADRIKELGIKEGMRTLRENAVRAVKAGRTSAAEMVRVTLEDI